MSRYIPAPAAPGADPASRYLRLGNR